MRTPLAALVWEIWQRGRRSACLTLGCITFCALVNLLTPEKLRTSHAGPDLFSTLFGLLMVLSFLLLMGIFNYTEFNSSREWNGFPYRLFVLPVRTWQLVIMPMLLGLVSVELLYLAWMKLVWTHENIPTAWFAMVLGAYMIFYQTTLWSLAGLRIMRLLVLSLGGVSIILVACMPMFDKIFPSPWFSERRLIPVLIAMAAFSVLVSLLAVARQRCGGGRRQSWFIALLDFISDALPRRTKHFASPAGAQFWFEWRRAGLVLPACTAFVLLVIFCPFSWEYRTDPRATVDILIRVLALPLALAFVMGKGFINPDFTSTKLELPSFMAIRPFSSGEFVITRMKVAALTVAIAWVLVLAFLVLWLPLWANTTQLQQLLFEFRMFYSHSWHVIIVLSVAGLVILTWRFMVIGLWVGLSGSRRFYIASLCLQVIVPSILLLIAAICSDKIDAAIRNHPDRVNTFLLSVIGWTLAFVVVAKLWSAVFSWRKITPRRTWQYLFIWSCLTLGFVVLGILARPWDDTYRQEHLYVLAALLLVPFARLGLAPLSLAKNRHR